MALSGANDVSIGERTGRLGDLTADELETHYTKLRNEWGDGWSTIVGYATLQHPKRETSVTNS